MKPDTIKSAQFEDSFFPVIDGVVKVVHNYAALMNRISYCCVVCPKPGAPYEDSRLPYDIFRTPSVNSAKWQYSVAWPGSMRGLEKLASDIRPDIIHVHSPFTQRTSALKLAKALNVPVVTTFHTKYYDDIFQITRSRRLTKRAIANIIRFYDQCDSVWACSEGAARTLREYGYRGRITVMPNGTNYVKPEDPERVAERAAKTFQITKKKKNLLFVGTQVWQKNLKLILDTMKLVCRRRKDIRIWIAGSGSDEEAIRKYAAGLGLTKEQVRFLGRVEDEELVAGLYLNADLLFFPSVYDTSSIVLREASVLETASLLTKGSNAADAVIPDVSGFVAEETPEAMAEKLLSVIDDKELLKQVGRKASETIPIPWEELIPRVYEEYARTIEDFREKGKGGRRRKKRRRKRAASGR